MVGCSYHYLPVVETAVLAVCLTVSMTTIVTTTPNRDAPPSSIILEGLPRDSRNDARHDSDNDNDDNDDDVLASLPVGNGGIRRGIMSSTASVATTQLASDVGSVMGAPKVAQLGNRYLFIRS